MRTKGMNRKIRNTVFVCSLTAALSVGSAFAYFTDRESTTNSFTVGSIDLTLTEPHWDTTDGNSNGIPDASENILPDQEIKKDPTVTNNGDNEEYVFLEVTVPTAVIRTANEDGTVNAAAETQLFSYTVDPNWTLVTSNSAVAGGETVTSVRNYTGNFGVRVPATATANGCIKYLYAYTGTSGADKMQALAAAASTQNLFQGVKMVNIVEDSSVTNSSVMEQEGQPLTVEVTAYGIQASYINNGDTSIDGESGAGQTSPAAVWTILAKQGSAIWS